MFNFGVFYFCLLLPRIGIVLRFSLDMFSVIEFKPPPIFIMVALVTTIKWVILLLSGVFRFCYMRRLERWLSGYGH